jgi:hypothetical protein
MDGGREGEAIGCRKEWSDGGMERRVEWVEKEGRREGWME